MRKRRKILTVSTAVVAAATLPLLISPVVSAAVSEDDDESPRVARLYAPPPDRDSYRQVARLAWRGDFRDSAGLLAMVRTPHAVWYGDETPEQVTRLVRRTARSAGWQGRLPVLALYNIPGRDCGSYSSGGADGLAAYQAWIDAVAEGIGDRKVMIVLEPDSLALLPSDCADASNAEETAVESQQPEQTAVGELPAAEESPAVEASPTELPPLPDPGAATAPPAASAASGTGEEAAQSTDSQPTDARPAAAENTAPKPPEAADPEPAASQSPDPEPSAEQPGTLPELPPLPTPDPVTPEDGSDTGDLDTPVVEDPETAARYSEINYAVDVLSALGNASVYLDAGHSGWHSVSSIVPRLIKAGIDRATGFALNVSHYQTDPDSAWYGRLVSSCLAYADEGGDPEDCAEQSWSRRHVRRWLRHHVPDDPARMKHYVTDTSRNGQGPWTPRAATHRHNDVQSWCNPPGRGLGRRPTTRTGEALLDAALWVKTPGESDGRCLRGTDGPLDPVRGTVNPEAGEWFPEQALELVRYADPAVHVFRRPHGR
ncbi:glycoside hydrolase family 6 protein [Streptomyces iranensis]|uniref:Glucanase n=1 Tax=Streptomyces iranensis TaxID=576784 RepID=A0A060ZJ23_9ACTN|nr:glycoside hydrolase family 6 protein [Streptomyces iranensis]MBP2063142.1 endoglucanase [Streptomyces iranensis]CDR05759.1 1, 4-beta cellobiohydrolase [Streptomyces iranensis]